MTDPLEVELRELGRSLDAPVPPGLPAAVMARVSAEPTRPRLHTWLSKRWRALVGGLTAVVLVGALTPPVRAAVAEWLGLGAVQVRTGTGAPPSSAPPPPTATGTSLADAREKAAFPVAVPARLGEPDSAEVSPDGQVVSLSWHDGAIRLDQVAGALAPYYIKTVHAQVHITTVRGGEALWLATPHELVVAGPGGERTEPPRLAGATLIWQSDGVTLRLEADLTLDEARAIAES
ncbi:MULTISPECIES: hypothetical protein [Actinokineospora]|uniref:DUF4367 domain-containing protein n=1 Tax=Actinokineospora fastidiosa TaxID=1816 RepID=A0A918GMP1_9PSEU|nr:MULTISPECIES: hypothetical protein [Actinokineospora]UVS78830.1 hypothetical protein Actkin_02566 [Actinokineospora sp. UTMC 2448]GGS47446.1 hypothetical protein GCM10010171_48370 [Actinokineospora fastidiosa]